MGAGADGTKYFLFGYMNRNWEEEIDVPVGPDNGFNVGGADQGQPTHFLPRRNRFVFRVKVPAGFTEKDELIWTLTTHGKTEKAYATLRPDYVVDDVVKASETGALGAGTSSPEVRAQQAAGRPHPGSQSAQREGGRAAHAGHRGQGRRHSEAARPDRGGRAGGGAQAPRRRSGARRAG